MAQGIWFDNQCYTQATINPGTVAASTSTDVAVTMQGLAPSDFIIAVTKPTLTAGVDIGNARATAVNQMKITFQNSGTTAAVVPSEVYSILVGRPEKTLGGPDALSGGNVVFK